MKFLQSSKGLYTLAFLLIIVTNIFIFVGAYVNKLGEPTCSIILSERELNIPYRSNNENSGLSLEIKYRMISDLIYKSYPYVTNPLWLDEAKLQELGFDIDKQKKYKNSKSDIRKEVFLVLELNGQAYKKHLKLANNHLVEQENKLKENPAIKNYINKVKNAKKNLYKEKNEASRLYAIDAGLDYEVLRQRYKNKTKYIIAKGLVRSHFKSYKKDPLLHVDGYISGLSVSALHVEKKFKSKLKNKNAKFNIEVKYGSRYEPWITSVE